MGNSTSIKLVDFKKNVQRIKSSIEYNTNLSENNKIAMKKQLERILGSYTIDITSKSSLVFNGKTYPNTTLKELTNKKFVEYCYYKEPDWFIMKTGGINGRYNINSEIILELDPTIYKEYQNLLKQSRM